MLAVRGMLVLGLLCFRLRQVPPSCTACVRARPLGQVEACSQQALPDRCIACMTEALTSSGALLA